MKGKKLEFLSNEGTTEQERQAYYRACIAEFQQLGYQDQYLAQCDDDLVPLFGVEEPTKKQ